MLEKIIFKKKAHTAFQIGIAFSILAIAGCNKQKIEVPPQTSSVSNNNYSVSIISTEGKKPLEEKLGDVDPVNRGFQLDINDDGIIDNVILRGDTLFFSKGLGNNTYKPEIPVLKIKEQIIAYRVESPPKPARPRLIYFNSFRIGYSQENRGLNSQGLPIFADAEATTGFDF